jgi:chlorobactene glucosyltransferase
MLVRRPAYDAVGGHAAVCSAICEDLEFARRLKQSGYTVLLMGGDGMLATRMYTGWATLWPGLAKNLVDTFGGPAATLGVAAAAVILAWAAYLLPLFDLWTLRSGGEGALSALILALAGSGAAIGLHIAAAFHFRIPFWYGFIFPAGYTVGALMALDSIHRRLSGRVLWKGRIYS